MGHRAKGSPSPVRVETSDNYAFAIVRHGRGDADQFVAKKLPFVDRNDGCSAVDTRKNVAGLRYRNGGSGILVVGGNIVGRIARINAWLKNLYILFSDFGAANLLDQLFGFAAEHATDNDFDPAVL